MTHPTVTLELRHSPAVDFIRHLREATHPDAAVCPLLLDLADQIEAQQKPAAPTEPADPAARVVDRDGYAWAAHDGLWYRLLPTIKGSWAHVVADFGPIEVRG